MKQFAGFAGVGFTSGIVNLAVYNAVLFAMRHFGILPEYDYLVALLAGYIISVLWAFLLNRKFIFTDQASREVPWYEALLKTYISYAFTGILLSSLLSLFWVNVIGLPKEILSVLNDLVSFPVNYLLIKYWSFHKTMSIKK